jgi:hypothetical protein
VSRRVQWWETPEVLALVAAFVVVAAVLGM